MAIIYNIVVFLFNTCVSEYVCEASLDQIFGTLITMHSGESVAQLPAVEYDALNVFEKKCLETGWFFLVSIYMGQIMAFLWREFFR